MGFQRAIAAYQGSCHGSSSQAATSKGGGECLTIALAGNANVGKSLIFNQITGSHQTIGNWPGKTVERAEGRLRLDGHDARVVDLPGIYSLSTFSDEEIVSREYIAHEKPDVVINVIGAPILERNLFFTLQLMEMGLPMVICLNQMDVAERQGIEIDPVRLEKMLGVPVVPTVAASGKGVRKLLETAVKIAERKREPSHNAVVLDQEIENTVADLTGAIDSEKLKLDYPARWVAVKLLEGDAVIQRLMAGKSEAVMKAAAEGVQQLEEAHGQPAFVSIASARYARAHQIAEDAQRRTPAAPHWGDRIDRLTTHRILGYVTAIAVVAALLVWTFTVGNILSGLMTHALGFFQRVDPQVSGTFVSILWNGLFGGFVAGVTLVIPYVVPFYLLLAALEDSGVLTRVAFMLDSAMHKMGLHGKAIIPIILGYGCNVPAIYSTRIMGTRRERLLTGFAITFSPCAARTIVIFGLVAAFVSVYWALALYVINLAIMFLVVKFAWKIVPGEQTGLIMEMHSFKRPSLAVMGKQTWARVKSPMIMVFPIYMLGSALVQGAYALGVLGPINSGLSFLTVGWLGLPVVAGVFLIFGAARKELILLMAVVIFGANLAAALTPAQLIVLALVGTIYPCFATVGTLAKEFGWKSASAIIGANLATAILVGGIAARLLAFVF